MVIFVSADNHANKSRPLIILIGVACVPDTFPSATAADGFSIVEVDQSCCPVSRLVAMTRNAPVPLEPAMGWA